MCTTFWDYRGVIYAEYLHVKRKEGTHWLKRGTLRLCTTFVRQLNTNVQGFSRLDIFHDNARAHTTGITLSFLANFGWIIFTHSLYSPNLAQSNYYLFPLLKTWLGMLWFTSDADLETKVNSGLQKQSRAFMLVVLTFSCPVMINVSIFTVTRKKNKELPREDPCVWFLSSVLPGHEKKMMAMTFDTSLVYLFFLF